MLTIQTTIGPLAYGGGVTLADWWDEKRITDGTLTNKEVLKKAGFWAFLGIGIPAFLMTAFDWMPRAARWTGPLSIGFLYGLPGFTRNTVTAVRSTTTHRTNTESEALRQAHEILRRKQSEAEAAAHAAGARATHYDVNDASQILV